MPSLGDASGRHGPRAAEGLSRAIDARQTAPIVLTIPLCPVTSVQPYTTTMIRIHRFDENFELHRGAGRA